MRNGDYEGMVVYGRPARRRWRRSSACVAAVAFLGATIYTGSTLTRWKGQRVDTLAGAYAVSPAGTYEDRMKALVAMQREARTVIEILRMMQGDADPRIVDHATNALRSIDESLR